MIFESISNKPALASLLKTDLSDNPYWVTDVQKDEPFGIDEVDVLSSGMVLFAHYRGDSLLHPDNGEIMVTIPNIHGFGGTQYVSNLGEDGINRFATMRGRALVEFNSEYVVKTLTSPALEEAFGDSHLYTFSQADKDIQPEIIVYSTFSTNLSGIRFCNIRRTGSKSFPQRENRCFFQHTQK